MELAKRYIVKADAMGGREVTTTLPNIIATLGAEPVLDFLGEAEKTFSLYVGAMEEASFINIIGDRDPGDCAVIVGDRADIQRRSVEMGVGLLIISGGFALDGEALEAAGKKGVSVIISPVDSAATAQLVMLSTPALEGRPG
jgi:manganese-dependent inorganic pyrophosphatase